MRNRVLPRRGPDAAHARLRESGFDSAALQRELVQFEGNSRRHRAEIEEWAQQYEPVHDSRIGTTAAQARGKYDAATKTACGTGGNNCSPRGRELAPGKL